MNYNHQNVNKNNKRPLSSKEYNNSNTKYSIVPQKYESSKKEKPKSYNHSFSDFNESQNKNEESTTDQYAYVQKLWQNLGVTDEYQSHFNSMLNSIDEEDDINNIIYNEKKSLNRFAENLIKLSKEIISRNNNIHSLQRVVYALAKNDQNLDEENEKLKRNKEKIIMEIIGLIKTLRKNSLNVVSYFIKVREIITYYRKIGKIDMKLISKDYKYSDNYLKKMKTDMDFLKNYPVMNKYFNMNNGMLDAFLTNFSPKPCDHPNYIKLNANKAKVPVSEELKNAIGECRFYLFQENIFDKMNYNDLETENNYYNTDNDNNQYNNVLNNNIKIVKNINNNINIRYDYNNKKNSKIIFFKNNIVENDEYQSIYAPYNNGKFYPLRNNNSASKVFNNSIELKERKKLEYLRINSGQDYNDLFMNNFQPKKRILKDNFPINDKNFRKPILTNKIKIEREERLKDRNPYILRTNFPSPLNHFISEIKELKKHLEEACNLNDNLQNDNSTLMKHIMENKKKMEKEKRAKEIREKEINQKEKEHQMLYKKMSSNIEELNSDKKDLNEKLKANQNLMDKYNKENHEKINNLNLKINEINFEKEELIKERNELINIKEQLTKEREELIQTKQNLEDKISGLELQISEDNIQLEQNKNTINENEQKIEEMGKKIDELSTNLDNAIKEKNILENNYNQKLGELSNKINDMEITIKNNVENIKNLENMKNELLNEKQELINSNNNAKMQINNLNDQINSLNIQKNDKDEQINTMKSDLDNLKKENIPLKSENQAMNIQLKNIKLELEELKNELKKYRPNYICDFYRGNLFNFINNISNTLSLDKIPIFMKESFNLEEINIFEENTYLKGVYPKIITVKKENSEDFTAICSIYYENYGYIGEPLILRIDALCSVEDNWELQIETMIKFVKENVFFDEIKYIIKYINENGKLKLDEQIKKFFKKRLKCSWKNVINLANGQRTQEICLVKEGDYFNKDINITNNNQFFGLKSLSVLSFYEDFDIMITAKGQEIPENILKKKYSNFYLKKYMNNFPILLLLANNPQYKMNFINEEDQKLYELPKCLEKDDYKYPKTQIKELTKMFFNIDTISSLKEKIKNFDTSNLLCEEAYNELQKQVVQHFSINYLTMEINLSTNTNYCLNYENYIYNRISSTKIDVLRDPETKNYFYLIPTNNEKVFMFVSQIGSKLKSILLDKKINLYKALAQLHPKLTNQLLKFSSFNVSKIKPEDMKKVIYIPSFKIDSHLYTFSWKDIDEKGKLINEKESSRENIGSIDELLKLSFEGDKNIQDNFTIIPVEDKRFNLIIREPFLFGIFNINILDSSPLQLFYVTKDHWIRSNQ